MLCSICHQNLGKYTCPKCKAKYCGVNCNKIHKEVCPGKPDSSEGTMKDNSEKEMISSPFEILKSFPNIVSQISDPRLQDIIKRIDSSADRETALIKELEINPDFEKFVHELLEVVPSSIEP